MQHFYSICTLQVGIKEGCVTNSLSRCRVCTFRAPLLLLTIYSSSPELGGRVSQQINVLVSGVLILGTGGNPCGGIGLSPWYLGVCCSAPECWTSLPVIDERPLGGGVISLASVSLAMTARTSRQYVLTLLPAIKYVIHTSLYSNLETWKVTFLLLSL